MERSKLMMVMAAVAFSLLVIVPRADATRYIVGGKMGWTNNVNYTAWAQGIHFYDGDWLFFVYDRDLMNVLEVNKTDYESCNADHPLGNWTTGAGRDVVPLNVTRYYYFISGKGFCNEGMKVAVRVENPPPPPKASPPLNEKSGFPSSFHRSHLVSPPAVSPIGAPWDVKSQSPSPTASALKEKSGSPSSIYGGQLVSPAVLAIGALWGAFFRAW